MNNVQFNQAITLLNNGQAGQANKMLITLSQEAPDDINILRALAYSYLLTEQHQNCVEVFEKITRLAANLVDVWADLAVVYYQQEKLDMAEQAFRKCIALDAKFGNGQAWHYLAKTLYKKQVFTEIDACIDYLNQYDQHAELIMQANNAIEQGALEQAEVLCRKVLSEDNQHTSALYLNAQCYSQKGMYEQAIALLNSGLDYAEYHHKLRCLLAQLYVQVRDYELALQHSTLLISQQGNELNNWLLHTDILVNLGFYQQALDCYQEALKYTQEPYYIWLQQAHIHKILGQSDLSAELYRKCTQNDEVKGAAYWGLSSLHGSFITEQDIQALEAMQLEPDISAEQASQAGFALARAYEQQERYPLAFNTYQYANTNKSGSQFNVIRYIKKCDSLIATFHSQLFTNFSNKRDYSVTPIFIVGLPRVGSTLVEQILSSHSQVEATMELKLIPAIAREIFISSCHKNQDSSGGLDKFSEEEFAAYGQKYIDKTAVYRTGKPYFIDKLPPNFQHIGLIKKILPQALIIDVRRHPMACGLGVYRQYFGQGFDFSYNLDHIAQYYQQYLRLMNHWQSLLPEQIYLCQYESLVQNTETEIKGLLNYCELEFETECLSFYQNERAVRTASSEQVKQPINNKGLDLWKHYQQELEPLRVALGDEIITEQS